MNNQVTITISGPTGSGKSAIAGEIEILCKSLGLPVEWDSGGSEKNLTGADWVGTLEMYKPSIRIVELASRDEAPATPQAGDDFSGCKPPMRHIPGVNVELLRRAALAQPTTVQQAGHCERQMGCVCGGDTQAVRERCGNWVKGGA